MPPRFAKIWGTRILENETTTTQMKFGTNTPDKSSHSKITPWNDNYVWGLQSGDYKQRVKLSINKAQIKLQLVITIEQQ